MANDIIRVGIGVEVVESLGWLMKVGHSFQEGDLPAFRSPFAGLYTVYGRHCCWG